MQKCIWALDGETRAKLTVGDFLMLESNVFIRVALIS